MKTQLADKKGIGNEDKCREAVCSHINHHKTGKAQKAKCEKQYRNGYEKPEPNFVDQRRDYISEKASEV